MRLLILASLAFLAGCGPTHEEFGQQRAEAAACSPGDTCVLAGSSQCVCPAPVNASKAAEIDAAAKEVRCGGAVVDCIFFTNVRCESGRCVADSE